MLKPILIQINPLDNVAIVVNDQGLEKQTVIEEYQLTLVDDVPQGHKVLLKALKKDEAIIRYGEIIGYANADLEAGRWVNESVTRMPEAPELDKLELATRPAQPLESLTGFTFKGYKNKDGSVGTKNILGITTSVNCVEGIVDYVVKIIERELLSKYPNVDGVVGLNHLYGCGVAIDAPAAIVPIRTIHNLALNPNFGGEIMVVSLGCEKMQPERLLNITAENKRIALADEDIIQLQDERHHGFESMVAHILTVAEQHLEKLNQRQRETVDASHLVVGMQCGGSDAFSGVTSNPAVGFATDLIVRCGGTVMFSEVTEVRDGIHLLTPRAANEDVAKDLIREMQWYDDYLTAGKVDRSANTTPGNKKGGLNNIVEKAMGSIAKSGTSSIVEVLSPGQRPSKKGLIFAATPSSDFICGTQQMASGITVQVFTTGRGTPYGLAAVPVIKMASRNNIANRWYDLIDISAGDIAVGKKTIEDVGWELFEMILRVASGEQQTWSDRWGIHNSLAVFNPAPVT
ncbi:galactarate dehydratase [Acinetobacter baylyi]|uniref:Galactarate dehydratase n=1 Tax=Acinetobacter baylyi TaxID=202950 RepID=A0ABU0UXM8_ACIBI|nr:galactarate dehydratase [Acinetobacter baylyi]MDQ1209315.1 galactarate dehydratase [Acinetobacter baylyi]MDR6107093.1 galactarate dehydratase [Acinetobacter baylyi]MDR6186187.1 galactarate dehydratase [Acinetobacter baylyi]